MTATRAQRFFQTFIGAENQKNAAPLKAGASAAFQKAEIEARWPTIKAAGIRPE